LNQPTVVSRSYLSEFSLKANFEVAFGVFIQRMKTITRYKGALIVDIITPSLFALFPILMGNALAGSSNNASQNFSSTAGTEDYILYMVIGANLFQVVNGAINNFGFFLRKEQMQGTLESLYLAPVNQFFVLLGTAFYTITRALINFFASLAFAGLIFGVNPFHGNVAIGFLFLIIGMIPIYGLAFGFGALVLKYKEINALQSIVMWIINLLMGIFFPITLFPKWLKLIAYIFPPTWHNNGVKASLTSSSYILKDLWYADFGIILLFALAFPLLGNYFYSRTDRNMRRTQGLGVF
jgi:ABC-2 type transport system permease protein